MDENDFHHGYGNYFRSFVLKVTWFQLRSKSFLDNYKIHWQRHLKLYFSLHTNSYLGKCHETKMSESALEIISCTKILAYVLWRTLHQNISLTIVFFIASQTGLVFKFNVALTAWISQQFVYLYLWIFCVSWSSSSASTLLS